MITCPLCRADLGAAATHLCVGCGTRYHVECLVELGGCSTLGCSERSQAVSTLEGATEPGHAALGCGGCLALLGFFPIGFSYLVIWTGLIPEKQVGQEFDAFWVMTGIGLLLLAIGFVQAQIAGRSEKK